MPKKVDVVTINGVEFVTATEAAKLIGWQRDSFTSKVSRGRAPQPELTIAGRRLYRLSDIVKWKNAMPGRGRRPHKTPASNVR